MLIPRQIITSILTSIYGRAKVDVSTMQIRRLEERLDRWFENLPSALQIVDAKELQYCPPPHVLSLNLLYHALVIILYRPFLSSTDENLRQRSLTVCFAQARIVHDIFILYGNTFRWRLMTYLVSYCVYTAATIDVYEMRTQQGAQARELAASRLSVSLRILESEARQTPGIRRSIDIIKRQLGGGRTGHADASIPISAPAPKTTSSQQGYQTANNQRSGIVQLDATEELGRPSPGNQGLMSRDQTFQAQMEPSGDNLWQDGFQSVGDILSGTISGNESQIQEGVHGNTFQWDFDMMDSGAGFLEESATWNLNDP